MAGDSPHWKAIELEEARSVDRMWTGSANGAIHVDEAKVARIGVPLAGRVARVNAELGYDVKVGTPLFSVYSADWSQLLAEQRKASLELEVAASVLARVSAIVQQGALPERELVAATQRLRQAELSQRAAQARLNSLSLASHSDHEFVVRAPRAGRVIEKRILAGQQLAPRTESILMTIADLSSVWLVADLFEAEVDGLVPGVPARVTVPSLPGRIFDGEVDMVSGVVDTERRTVPVRVRLGNADRFLKLNMFARVQFLVTVPSSSAETAASALRSDGSRQYVYVQRDGGQFTRRYVTAGAVRADRALIAEGIAPGERIVIKGASLLDNRLDIADEGARHFL